MARSPDSSFRSHPSATVEAGAQPAALDPVSSRAVASPPWLDWLDRHYELSDRKAVRAYLERTPFLIPVLSDAAAEIQRRFEPGDVPILEVVQDRESLANQLYVIIRTSMSPDAANRRLDRLDDEWWLDALDAARGALTIDVEPR